MFLSLSLAFLAGLLSILSPFVLPLVPIVLGTALSQHRLGPVVLAAGLALSFVAIGLFVALFGFAIGLDSGFFRAVGAVMLFAVGVLMVAPDLSTKLAAAAGPVGNWAEQQFGGFSTVGLWGQFGVGLLLGMVWSPCVGPTLGAASVLAAQGKDLGQVAGTMAMFGIGSAVPLLLLGLLSRQRVLRWRGTLGRTSFMLKTALGVLLLMLSGSILLGFDRAIEADLVTAAPQWLTDLTTRF
jgi:cytochrome c-type biogenesis protein